MNNAKFNEKNINLNGDGECETGTQNTLPTDAQQTAPNLKNVIFDLGGVLIDWNPRHMYKKIFQDKQEMENFLAQICTDAWNLEQDAGRTLEEGTQILCQRHPDKAPLIKLFYGRWTEMLGGTIDETVAILYELKARGVRLYSLTNWSHETFPYARQTFPFLNEFLDIVVSGEEKLLKPDSRIYEILLARNNLRAAESVFVDDKLTNVRAAEALGMRGVHFTAPHEFAAALRGLKLL